MNSFQKNLTATATMQKNIPQITTVLVNQLLFSTKPALARKADLKGVWVL